MNNEILNNINAFAYSLQLPEEYSTYTEILNYVQHYFTSLEELQKRVELAAQNLDLNVADDIYIVFQNIMQRCDNKIFLSDGQMHELIQALGDEYDPKFNDLIEVTIEMLRNYKDITEECYENINKLNEQTSQLTQVTRDTIIADLSKDLEKLESYVEQYEGPDMPPIELTWTLLTSLGETIRHKLHQYEENLSNANLRASQANQLAENLSDRIKTILQTNDAMDVTSDLQKQLNEATDRALKIEFELNERKREMERFEETNKRELLALRQQLENANKKYGDLELAFSERELKVYDQLQTKENQIGILESQLTETRLNANDIETRLKTCTQNTAKLTEDYKTEIGALKEALQNAQHKIVSVERELAACRSREGTCVEKNRTLKTDLAEQNARLAEYVKQVSKIETHMTKLKQTLTLAPDARDEQVESTVAEILRAKRDMDKKFNTQNVDLQHLFKTLNDTFGINVQNLADRQTIIAEAERLKNVETEYHKYSTEMQRIAGELKKLWLLYAAYLPPNLIHPPTTLPELANVMEKILQQLQKYHAQVSDLQSSDKTEQSRLQEQIKRLQKDIGETNLKMHKLEQTHVKYSSQKEAEIANLTDQINQLKSDAQLSQRGQSERETQLRTDLENARKELRDKQDAYNQEIDALVQDRAQKIQKSENLLQESRALAQRLTDENDTLRDHNARIDEELRLAREQHATLSRTYNELLAKYDELSTENTKLNEFKYETFTRLKDLTQKISTLEKEKSDINVKYIDASENQNRLEDDYRDLQTRLDMKLAECANKYDAYNLQISNLEQDVRILQEEKRVLEKNSRDTLDEFQTRIDVVKKEYAQDSAQMRNENERQIEAYENRIQILQARIDTIQSELDNAIETDNATIDDLKARLEDVTTKYDALNATHDNLQKTYDSRQTQYDNLLIQAKKLQQERNDAKDKIRSDTAKTDQTIKNLQKRLEIEEREHELVKKVLDAITQDYENLIKIYSETIEIVPALNQVKFQNETLVNLSQEDLKRQLQALHANYTRLTDVLANKQSTISKLKISLQEANRKQENFETERQKLLTRIEDLQKNVSSYMDQINHLKNQYERETQLLKARIDQQAAEIEKFNLDLAKSEQYRTEADALMRQMASNLNTIYSLLMEDESDVWNALLTEWLANVGNVQNADSTTLTEFAQLYQNLVSKINALSEEYKQANITINALTQTVSQLEAQRDRFLAEVNDTRKSIALGKTRLNEIISQTPSTPSRAKYVDTVTQYYDNIDNILAYYIEHIDGSPIPINNVDEFIQYMYQYMQQYEGVVSRVQRELQKYVQDFQLLSDDGNLIKQDLNQVFDKLNSHLQKLQESTETIRAAPPLTPALANFRDSVQQLETMFTNVDYQQIAALPAGLHTFLQTLQTRHPTQYKDVNELLIVLKSAVNRYKTAFSEYQKIKTLVGGDSKVLQRVKVLIHERDAFSKSYAECQSKATAMIISTNTTVVEALNQLAPKTQQTLLSHLIWITLNDVDVTSVFNTINTLLGYWIEEREAGRSETFQQFVREYDFTKLFDVDMHTELSEEAFRTSKTIISKQESQQTKTKRHRYRSEQSLAGDTIPLKKNKPPAKEDVKQPRRTSQRARIATTATKK